MAAWHGCGYVAERWHWFGSNALGTVRTVLYQYGVGVLRCTYSTVQFEGFSLSTLQLLVVGHGIRISLQISFCRFDEGLQGSCLKCKW